eukprot:TRINITY_DN120124_c6_g1_i1.p2 TRINITY_DN120124_c6_g1~~TRINITY_DN120124_c6_g1_i1.p2  ORF type:complete len:532 (+),score=67.23 TRINITY_DN120124_c6_g1_i1:9772-11367(+)
MIASQQGNESIVKTLLAYHPNINKEDKFGKKAHDRTQDQNIFYLLQSAAIDQRIKISETRVMSAVGEKAHAKCEKKQLAKSFDVRKENVKIEEDKKDIMEYYKAHFADQVKKLTDHLSKSVQHRLRVTIEKEVAKSSDWLRGVLGGEMNNINDKIKEQIDQHISLKIRLASARAGIDPISEDQLKESLANIRINLGSDADKENFKYSHNNSPSQQNDTTITEILTEKECNQPSRHDNVEISKWSKDKRDLYNMLKKQMTLYVSKQLDEIAGRLSDGTLERLLAVLNKKLNGIESNLRTEITKSFTQLTKDFKSRIDMIITEKMTRAAKRMKDKLTEEKKQVRSESLRLWNEEERSRLTSGHFDPSLWVAKKVPPLPIGQLRKPSLPKLPEQSIHSLQIAKESPIEQTNSTRNMFKYGKRSRQNVKSVLNQPRYNCMGFRNAKATASLGHTPRTQSAEGNKISPNSAKDKLELLYKQYANVYQRNSGESKKNTVEAWRVEDMPLSRRVCESIGSMSKGEESDTIIAKHNNKY